MEIRQATARDVLRVTGPRYGPEFLATYPHWLMWAAERNGAVLALGGACWDHSGQCWVTAPPANPRWSVPLHRMATRLIRALKDVEPSIQVYRGAGVPTAERWLRHFGFEYSHEAKGEEVWRWQS